MSRALRLALVAAAACVGACSSLEKQRADALGGETETPGPRHRPGQPCLYCHSTSEGDGRGGVRFDLAGTVYRRRGDSLGAPDVEIAVEDAAGKLVRVTSNRAGNFALIAEAGLTAPIASDEGIWRVPGPLVFPLHTSVREGGITRNMRNVIHREPSCSVCHTDSPGAASNGRIFVIDDADAGVADAGVADAGAPD